PLAELGVNGESGKGARASRGEIEPQQIRLGTDADVAARDAEGEGRNDDRMAAVAGAHADAEGHLRRTDRERDLVSGNRAAEQGREVPHPGGPRGNARHDAFEPDCQAGRPLRGELLERKRRHVAAGQAQEPGERRERPRADRVGLGANEPEDQVQGALLELAEIAGRHRQVAGRARSGQLEPSQRQRELRSDPVGRRDLHRQADASERRRRSHRDLGLQPDRRVRRLADEDRTGYGVPFLRCPEEGHVGARLRVGRRRGQAHTRSDGDEVGRRGIEDEVRLDVRVRVLEDREPEEAVGVGLAGGAAEDLVEERDQGVSLRLLGDDAREVIAGAAEPIGIDAAAGIEEPQGPGELLDFPEIDAGGAHEITRSNVWRAMVRTLTASELAVMATGMSAARSVSVPIAAAAWVATVMSSSQANATSASLQTAMMASGPRGRASVATRSPAGEPALPTAKGTWTVAPGT